MKNYRVVGKICRLGQGSCVAIDEAQYRRRAHRVTPVDGRDGVYTLNEPLEFKSGEKFGLEGDLAKAAQGMVREMGKPSPKPDGKAKLFGGKKS